MLLALCLHRAAPQDWEMLGNSAIKNGKATSQGDVSIWQPFSLELASLQTELMQYWDSACISPRLTPLWS